MDQPCQECANQAEKDKCPYCHCSCELTAITVFSDEDCFCHRCQKKSIMSPHGRLIAYESDIGLTAVNE